MSAHRTIVLRARNGAEARAILVSAGCFKAGIWEDIRKVFAVRAVRRIGGRT